MNEQCTGRSLLIKRLLKNLQTRCRPDWRRLEVAALYGAAAKQARQPEFYQAGGVPDTIDGRFDLLSLHIALIMLRLRGEKAADAARMRQHLFDFFGADLDRNLRELGVGDMGIARRIKVMGQGFYGRLAAYQAALAQPEATRITAVMTALDKNLYGTVPTVPEALRRMAEYVVRTEAALHGYPLERFLNGTINFERFF